MPSTKNIMITGAFSFSGKYVAKRLLEKNYSLHTLTNHPDTNSPMVNAISINPLDFNDTDQLKKSLEGMDILINTYWIRFPYGNMTYEKAVENTKLLFDLSKKQGVKRIVHISISNPSLSSDLPYFKGKAELEQHLKRLGISYSIIRPTVIFGDEGILINNIAFIIKTFPFFAVMGDGDYQLQPIYVEDLAQLIVQAVESDENQLLDAIGPEVYTFDSLIQVIAQRLNKFIHIFHVSPGLAYFFTKILGWFVSDVIITKDEIKGLMNNLLVSADPPTGTTKLSDWIEQNKDQLGKHYQSELKRHF